MQAQKIPLFSGGDANVCAVQNLQLQARQPPLAWGPYSEGSRLVSSTHFFMNKAALVPHSKGEETESQRCCLLLPRPLQIAAALGRCERKFTVFSFGILLPKPTRLQSHQKTKPISRLSFSFKDLPVPLMPCLDKGGLVGWSLGADPDTHHIQNLH